jgi:UDP-N-acetylglucosamine 1-carboxyvinyltransferase
VNYHLDALKAMGAEIDESGKAFVASAPNGLRGTHVKLPYPSVGATENILLAGVLAKGRTVIENAALEPEILDLVMMLQNMGAIIELGTGRVIAIDGVERLRGCSHAILPDRMEAASYACMALATKGRIFCRHARQEHMITFLNAVRRIGADYEVLENGIVFFVPEGATLRGIDLETDTHPGFMTDWQQPFTLLLTQCEGTSVVHETVYEDRFGYTRELNRLGANITVFDKCLGELPCRFRTHRHPHSAIVQGPTPPEGRTRARGHLRHPRRHHAGDRGVVRTGDHAPHGAGAPGPWIREPPGQAPGVGHPGGARGLISLLPEQWPDQGDRSRHS